MYLKNRYIDESGRLVFDIIENAKIKITEGFLVTDDNFLISPLENYKFGNNFISW